VNSPSFEVLADGKIIGGFKLGDLPYPIRTEYQDVLGWTFAGCFEMYFAEWVLKYNIDTWSDHIKDTVLTALAHSVAGHTVTVERD